MLKKYLKAYTVEWSKHYALFLHLFLNLILFLMHDHNTGCLSYDFYRILLCFVAWQPAFNWISFSCLNWLLLLQQARATATTGTRSWCYSTGAASQSTLPPCYTSSWQTSTPTPRRSTTDTVKVGTIKYQIRL